FGYTPTVFRRNGKNMIETKPIGLSDFSRLLFSVNFVDDEENGLAGAPQQSREFLISRREGRTAVDHKVNDRRVVHRYPGLLNDLARNLGLLARHDSARVDDAKSSAAPRGGPVNPIPRDSRFISNNRTALSDETVKECRFADVGPANDGNQMTFRHDLW